MSKVTQQWAAWEQEPRFLPASPPPPNSFLRRVGFSWHLPGTRRQMGNGVAKMPEEGFRAQEWEILDNLSCLGEVMDMVKRGRTSGSTSGRCSLTPTEHITFSESLF